MPAFNASKTIADSVKSVLAQVYINWELIIVNDGSKDDTKDIAESFQEKDNKIIILTLPNNKGLSNARNEGCKFANGCFIAFLDSDDLWHREKLKRQITFHLLNPAVEISHTDFHLFTSKGLLKRPLKYLVDFKRYKEGNIYPRICYRNPIGILTVMITKRLLLEVGFFDDSLWTMEDQDLWVRIARKGTRFGYISQILSYYRISLDSITSKTGKYKRAYKKYISKVMASESVNRNLMLSYYNRYFGTVYFKHEQYALSQLYFLKSIKLAPMEFINISSVIYFLYGFFRNLYKGKS